MCKYNDEGRRNQNSLITIEKSDFEYPDKEEIKEKTGYNITILEKDIIKKPDYIKKIYDTDIKVIGDYMLSQKWIISGQSRSYDADYNNVYSTISGEKPVEFEELYDFLEKYKPDLTALKLRHIQKELIEYDEEKENDYYSNVTYGFYKININKLIEYLNQ